MLAKAQKCGFGNLSKINLTKKAHPKYPKKLKKKKFVAINFDCRRKHFLSVNFLSFI